MWTCLHFSFIIAIASDVIWRQNILFGSESLSPGLVYVLQMKVVVQRRRLLHPPFQRLSLSKEKSETRKRLMMKLMAMTMERRKLNSLLRKTWKLKFLQKRKKHHWPLPSHPPIKVNRGRYLLIRSLRKTGKLTTQRQWDLLLYQRVPSLWRSWLGTLMDWELYWS